jgi:CheY-like chemotaxis protein
MVRGHRFWCCRGLKGLVGRSGKQDVPCALEHRTFGWIAAPPLMATGSRGQPHCSVQCGRRIKVNGGQKPRILVVEDEFMVGLLIEDMVLDFGGAVVGPAARFDCALQLARDADIDVAILDINLAGTLSYPIARVLRERGIPLIFATGYGESVLSTEFRDHPVLAKPFARKEFDEALSAALLAGAASK